MLRHLLFCLAAIDRSLLIPALKLTGCCSSSFDECPPQIDTNAFAASIPLAIAFALKIAAIFAPLNLAYYVGGSVASSLHGESRATRDINLAVVIAPDAIDVLIQAFVEANFISEVAVREAVESIEPGRSFNVIDTASAEKADIFPLKGEPERISFAARFAQSQMARRQLLDFPDGQIYVCTAEDIILQKLKWRRTSRSTEQWSDILGVMKLQQAQLDFDYLWRWAAQLQVEVELAQVTQEAGL